MNRSGGREGVRPPRTEPNLLGPPPHRRILQRVRFHRTRRRGFYFLLTSLRPQGTCDTDVRWVRRQHVCPNPSFPGERAPGVVSVRILTEDRVGSATFRLGPSDTIWYSSPFPGLGPENGKRRAVPSPGGPVSVPPLLPSRPHPASNLPIRTQRCRVGVRPVPTAADVRHFTHSHTGTHPSTPHSHTHHAHYLTYSDALHTLMH